MYVVSDDEAWELFQGGRKGLVNTFWGLGDETNRPGCATQGPVSLVVKHGISHDRLDNLMTSVLCHDWQLFLFIIAVEALSDLS